MNLGILVWRVLLASAAHPAGRETTDPPVSLVSETGTITTRRASDKRNNYFNVGMSDDMKLILVEILICKVGLIICKNRKIELI